MHDNNFYQKIDNICDMAVTNIYTLSKGNQMITFENIDCDRDDHMFLVNIGLIARDIFGWPLYFYGSFWKWVKLFFRTKKENQTYLRYVWPWKRKRIKDTIDPDMFLNFMKPLLDTIEEEKVSYSTIYKIYYSSEREI